MKLESVIELNQKLTVPLKIYSDESKNIESFIISDYNRIENSYRSPHTNEFYPTVNVAKYPPEELRVIERDFGRLLKEYSKLYYNDNSISSVYSWDYGDSISNGFGLCALIYSEDTKRGNIMNSTNVFNIKFSSEIVKNTKFLKALYKLTSTMTIYLKINDTTYVTSSLTKSLEDSIYLNDYLDYASHFEKIGKMIESLENSLRIELELVHLTKVKDIIGKLKIDYSIKQKESLMDNLLKEQNLQNDDNQ